MMTFEPLNAPSPTSPPPLHPADSLFSPSESKSLEGFLAEFAADPLIQTGSSTSPIEPPLDQHPLSSDANMLRISDASSSPNHRTFRAHPRPSYPPGTSQPLWMNSSKPYHPSPSHSQRPSHHIQPNPLQLEFEPHARYLPSNQSYQSYHSTLLPFNPPAFSSLSSTHHLQSTQPTDPHVRQQLTTSNIQSSDPSQPDARRIPPSFSAPSAISNQNPHIKPQQQPPELSLWMDLSPVSRSDALISPSESQSSQVTYPETISTHPPPPRHRHHPSLDSAITHAGLPSTSFRSEMTSARIFDQHPSTSALESTRPDYSAHNPMTRREITQSMSSVHRPSLTVNAPSYPSGRLSLSSRNCTSGPLESKHTEHRPRSGPRASSLTIAPTSAVRDIIGLTSSSSSSASSAQSTNPGTQSDHTLVAGPPVPPSSTKPVLISILKEKPKPKIDRPTVAPVPASILKKEKPGLLSQEQKRANHIASEQKVSSPFTFLCFYLF